jgi:hypothetical protein
MMSGTLFLIRSQHLYFVLPGLTFGEGDAAGDAVAAGLGLFAGAVSVALLGVVAVTGEGVAVVGVFELLAGSQAVAKPSEMIVRSSRATRFTVFMLGVFIGIWPRFSKIEKHADDCPEAIK